MCKGLGGDSTGWEEEKDMMGEGEVRRGMGCMHGGDMTMIP